MEKISATIAGAGIVKEKAGVNKSFTESIVRTMSLKHKQVQIYKKYS